MELFGDLRRVQRFYQRDDYFIRHMEKRESILIFIEFVNFQYTRVHRVFRNGPSVISDTAEIEVGQDNAINILPPEFFL